jgi:hypothetical protein
MKYSSKVFTTNGDTVQVYYRKGVKGIEGKLVHCALGNYYERTNGDICPVILDSRGVWMAVITETPPKKI